jgi:probable O-glycosylation ligase (exosortase A-associated)
MEKGLLFTYLLTYGGACAALVNPFIGLLAYVCLAVLKPETLWYWSSYDMPGNSSRIVALALLIGWVLQGCGDWQFGRAGTVVAALSSFLAWSVVSAVYAEDQEVAWMAVESLAKIVIPFVVGMTLLDSVQRVKQLAWVILASQGYVAYEMNLSYFGGFNRLHEAGGSGMDNNSLAIALVATAALGFFLGLDAHRWWRKAIAYGFTLAVVHAVFLSFSRGAMIALTFTAVVSFLLIPKQFKHYVIFTVAVLLCLRLAGAEVRERFMTSFAQEEKRDASAQSRVMLWGDCLDSIKKNPWVGLGPEHWPLKVEKLYHWPKGKHAHTLWLQLGAELGVPALVFLILFYLLCITGLCGFLLAPPPRSDPWLRGAARMVIAAIAGFMVAAQFVSLPGLELPYYVTLVGAGVLKLSSMPAAAMTPSAGSSSIRVDRAGRSLPAGQASGSAGY